MVLSTTLFSSIKSLELKPVSSKTSSAAQSMSDSSLEIFPRGKDHELDSKPLTKIIFVKSELKRATPRTGMLDLYLPNWERASCGFPHFQINGHFSKNLAENPFIFIDGNRGSCWRKKSV